MLGRIARARDRVSMAQKNSGIVFHYLVGRSEWDIETANGLHNAQRALPKESTLDHAIESLEEAVHDLKLVRQELQERSG